MAGQQVAQGQGQLQGQELYRLTRVAFSELRQVRGGSREFNKSSKVVRAWFRVLQLSQLPQADWERVRTRLAFNPDRQGCGAAGEGIPNWVVVAALAPQPKSEHRVEPGNTNCPPANGPVGRGDNR